MPRRSRQKRASAGVRTKRVRPRRLSPANVKIRRWLDEHMKNPLLEDKAFWRDFDRELRGNRISLRLPKPTGRKDWRRIVITDPAILVGKPVIKGTRIAVELVLELLAEGWTLEDLLDSYPGITEEDIRACLACAAAFLHAHRRCVARTAGQARDAKLAPQDREGGLRPTCCAIIDASERSLPRWLGNGD